MSGFKLLAIRPVEGCDEKFLKNVYSGTVYSFYTDYELDLLIKNRQFFKELFDLI